MSNLKLRETMLRDFLAEKSLAPSDLTDLMANRVFALRAAAQGVKSAKQAAVLKDTNTVAGVLENVLFRTVDMVEGAIVAEVAGLFPPSELLSRAALEYSAKVLYMLQEDTADRVSAYLFAYPESVDRGLANWKSECSPLSNPEQQRNFRAIDAMQVTNDMRRDWLKMLATPQARFPKTAHQIFAEAGLSLEYRTLYWRLSSQTHGDAEDTINYMEMMLLHRSGQKESVEVSVTEAIVFTRWYAHMVLQVFLRACQEFHEMFAGSPSDELASAQREIDEDAAAFARWMGNPSKDFPWIGGLD